MFSRKITLVAAAAGAAAIVAAPSAFAAGITYNISAGTHHSGTAAFTGKTSSIKFVDKTSGVNMGCAGGTAGGVLNLGKAIAATGAGNITKTTWTKCSGPGGLQLNPSQVGKWHLNGRGKTANGNTPVYVSGVTANVKNPQALCSFTVKGAADGVYHNATHALSLAPVAKSGHVLKVSNVSGCLSQVNNGDVVTFTATYAVSSTSGAIKITSN